jgi:hypothetical protein
MLRLVLIGAITPVTTPTETIINNVISMIAGGNGVVFNVISFCKKVLCVLPADDKPCNRIRGWAD